MRSGQEGFDRNFDFAFLSSHSALVCDTQWAVSSPDCPCRKPVSASRRCPRAIARGLDLHKKCLGSAEGVWPSEARFRRDAAIATSWSEVDATDEGVLGGRWDEFLARRLRTPQFGSATGCTRFIAMKTTIRG